MKPPRWAVAAASLAAVAAGLGTAVQAQAQSVARAGGMELQGEQAAAILAANADIPADPQIVRRLADLWVDYTLLASAAADDPSLAALNLDDLVREQQEEQEVSRYLEAQVKPAAALTDAELDRLWASEGPGEELHARHILLTLPGDEGELTPARREQLRARAEAVRVRAAAGADFEALARETTEEPGGKERGGDLGWFGRGQMVPQFEEAAFRLQPGQVSPVVETQFGYHVIKVEGRRQQPIGENREAFRQQRQEAARQRALAAHIDSLRKTAAIAVQPGAEESFRALAGQADPKLRGPAAANRLVAYQGGEVTAQEVADMMQIVPAEGREQLRAASAEQIREFLETHALREFLVAEAHRKNVRLTAAETAAIRTEMRNSFRELLKSSGLADRPFAKGPPGHAAVQQAVRSLMEEAVTNRRQLPPLGRAGILLRKRYGGAVEQASLAAVAERLKAIRAARPAQPQPGSPAATPTPGENRPSS